ncbi:MAG: hypothetical protein EOP05_02215 [Proteobacteria bacterium]|nr:MAG: hypothetical protein EOP05_02215 [Pseudomonadota bacterium]
MTTTVTTTMTIKMNKTLKTLAFALTVSALTASVANAADSVDTVKPDNLGEVASKAGFRTPKGSAVRLAEVGDLNGDQKNDLIVMTTPSKADFVGAASMSIYLNKGSSEKPRLDLVFSNNKLVKSYRDETAVDTASSKLDHTISINDPELKTEKTYGFRMKSQPPAALKTNEKIFELAWDKSGQQFNVIKLTDQASECTTAESEVCKQSETIYDFRKQEITRPDTTTCAFNKKVRTPTLEMLAAGQNLISGIECK